MNISAIQEIFSASLYPNRGLTFNKGEGSYLITETGEKYLDCISGSFGVSVLGHSNSEVMSFLHKQIDKLMTLHSSFANEGRAIASKMLIGKIKKDGFISLKKVFWSNSGTEANEAALKFAVLATGKTRFISANNSYHGKTLGSLSVNSAGDGKYQKPFKKLLAKVDYVKYGDIDELTSKLTSEHAAFILEPIQGEGGVIVPESTYLSIVSKLCKSKGVILILDEIQTGVGRTGGFLNSTQYVKSGVHPDIICLGKGLAGGVPVGATIITAEIDSHLKKGIHTSTFGGNPLVMAGVVGTLTYFENHPEIYEQTEENGNYFIQALKKMQKDFPKIITEISGQGLMIGVEITVDPATVLKKLQMAKIIAAPTSTNRIRFLPPLVITKKEIDFVLDELGKIVRSPEVVSSTG